MNPFGKYENSLRKLSTINSGQRYHESYATMIQNPDTDFLMPIIFSCDETKISSMGRTSCWPLMFTTTILNQSCRNKPEAWKPLGYVYDLSLAMSQAEEKQLGNDLKYTRLHRVFRTILKSYVDAQHCNALSNIPIRLGNQTKNVNLKVPCFLSLEICKGVINYALQHLYTQIH